MWIQAVDLGKCLTLPLSGADHKITSVSHLLGTPQSVNRSGLLFMGAIAVIRRRREVFTVSSGASFSRRIASDMV